MKRFPVVLSSQAQNSNRADQLMPQDMSALILNESQIHRSTPIQNNLSISPKPIQLSNLNQKFESNNEFHAINLSESTQHSNPNLIHQKSDEIQ